MDNKELNVSERVGNILGALLDVAFESGQQAKEAKRKADEWYGHFMRKNEECKELQAMLAAEIEGHQKTKAELEEFAKAVQDLAAENEQLRAERLRATSER